MDRKEWEAKFSEQKETVKGMTPAEKQTVVILVAAACIAVALVMWIF